MLLPQMLFDLISTAISRSLALNTAHDWTEVNTNVVGIMGSCSMTKAIGVTPEDSETIWISACIASGEIRWRNQCHLLMCYGFLASVLDIHVVVERWGKEC